MKQILLSLSLLLLLFFFTGCKEDILEIEEDKFNEKHPLKAEQGFSLNNWMKRTNQNRSISYLSIPGTHNSGARQEAVYSTAKCQDLTITQQLNAGVRYLDIRCRHYNNNFVIHHGPVYQKINFDNVLEACWNFLEDNPSETIVMSVRQEHTAEGNSRSFEATFDSYVAKKPNGWYLRDYIPKMKDAKGKIVLVRRFDIRSGTKGIPATSWKDNTSFSINNSHSSLKIQDVYQAPDNLNKWNSITSYFDLSTSDSSGTLYLNHTNGYKRLWFGIPDIRAVSGYINSKLSTYFNDKSGRYGVVIQDFCTAKINEKIIAANF